MGGRGGLIVFSLGSTMILSIREVRQCSSPFLVLLHTCMHFVCCGNGTDYDVQEFLLLFCRLACVYVVGFMSVLSLSVLSKIACVYAAGFHVSSQFVSTE